MSVISPKLAKALTTAIVRRASKHYPSPGIVGVYGFAGKHYSRKPELREAVLEFCSTLTYEQVPAVKKNLGLI